MSEHCDICIVEDDASDRALLERVLSKAGYRCVLAEDGEVGWKLIESQRPKVIVADWDLPIHDGLTIGNKLRATKDLASTFFLMVTGTVATESREKALQVCADDYITKPIDRPLLLARVRLGMRMWEATERLQRAAITDGLTGLFNHDHITSVIEQELNRARRYGNRLSLIMLDLDFFKAVNDTYGHLAGNATLVALSDILRENVREFDTVGRYGGEEFAIVAPESTMDDAAAISQRIRLAISDTLRIPETHDHSITASFGVASADDARVQSAADLIDLADRALYAAKGDGRNRVSMADEVSDDESFAAVEGKEVEALRKRVAVLCVQAKDVYIQSVSSLVQAMEEKDPFTARHSINVSQYSEQIAATLNVNESLVITIRNAGLLHDVGKVGIPDRILLKPAGLSDVEAMVMQQVPAISVRILDHLRILESEIHIIRHQREYFDGSGYPDGLKGDQIPIGSRILLVANAFDAMTTDRVYRTCRTVEGAMKELRASAGRQFDPQVVNAMEMIVQTQRDDIRERIKSTAEALRTTCVPL